MADSQLRILIDALWRGRQGTASARDDLRGIGQAADAASDDLAQLARSGGDAGDSIQRSAGNVSTASLRWTELASAVNLAQIAYRGASDAVSTLMGALEEGAELELAEVRFGRLATAIGTTSDALMSGLRSATSGMVADADLISSATDIIQRGLADTSEGVIKLATLAGELNLDMEILGTTLANDSKLRLDTLGLSVETVTKRMEELKEEGIAAGEAFDIAVVEGLEDRLLTVGSAADTTAGDVRRLQADWQNMKNALVQDFASEVDLKSVGEDVRELTTDLVQLSEVAFKLIGPLQALADVGRKIMEFPLSPPGALLWLIERFGGDGSGGELGQGMRGAAQGTDQYTAALTGAASASGDLATSTGDAAGEVEKISETFKELARQVEAGERQADDFAESLDRLRRGQGEGILLSFAAEVDTATAEAALEGFVFEWQGKNINIGVNVTETGEGGLPSTEEAATSIAGDIFEDIQFERRYIIAAEAELDEKKWRQEMMDLRPQLEDAIKAEMGISDSPLGADFEIPISPTVQAEIDRQALMDDMEAGLLDVQALIDRIPPRVEPEVDDQQLDDLISFLDGDVSSSLDGVFGEIHALETTDNLPVLDMRLQNTLNLVNAVTGTKHLNIIMTTTTAGGSNPHTGPYEDPGGPTPDAPAPSVSLQTPQTAGQTVNIAPGAIVVNGVSDPNRAAELVVQKLEDRGVVARVRLR